jgi:hypothetical protein
MVDLNKGWMRDRNSRSPLSNYMKIVGFGSFFFFFFFFPSFAGFLVCTSGVLGAIIHFFYKAL